MSEPLAGLIVGSVVWVGVTFFTIKDFLSDRAEVQFITGWFTPISRNERPRSYWAVTIFRALIILVLGIALIVEIGESF